MIGRARHHEQYLFYDEHDEDDETDDDDVISHIARFMDNERIMECYCIQSIVYTGIYAHPEHSRIQISQQTRTLTHSNRHSDTLVDISMCVH